MPAADAPAGGEGEQVVLLPSLGRPGSDFDALAGGLGARGWRTIAIDLHQLVAHADLHGLAAEITGVLGASCDGPVHIVGHAFGNRVARCIAADAPDLVRSLVLLGCGGKVKGDADAHAALARCFEPGLGAEEHRQAVATAFFAPPGRVPDSWASGWHPAAAAAQSAASLGTDVDDWWVPPAPIPVLAVVGAQDRISPPVNARSLVAELGWRGRLVEVAGAGHALLPEQPEAVLDTVSEFLASTAHDRTADHDRQETHG